jgi:hypothetical protein
MRCMLFDAVGCTLGIRLCAKATLESGLRPVGTVTFFHQKICQLISWPSANYFIFSTKSQHTGYILLPFTRLCDGSLFICGCDGSLFISNGDLSVDGWRPAPTCIFAAQSPRRCHSSRHPMISVFHCIKPAACTNGVIYRARKFLSPPFITELYCLRDHGGPKVRTFCGSL